MKIIRGRLSADDTQPKNARWDATCGCVQTTSDGGLTWIDDPAADPRHSVQYLMPILTGGDPQCDAAANAVKFVKDYIDGVIIALDEGVAGFTLASAAVTVWGLIFFEVGLLVDLFLALGAALAELGAIALTDAFAGSTYDDLLCLFYCAMDSSGQVSSSSFAVLSDAIAASAIDTTAKTVLAFILSLMGEIGLSNAGSVGSETGDCSGCAACGWVIEIDYAAGFQDTFLYKDSAGRAYGALLPGGVLNDILYPPKTVFMIVPMVGAVLSGASYFGTTFHGTGIGNLAQMEDVTGTPGANNPAYTAKATVALPTVSAAWQTFSFAFTVTVAFGLFLLCDGNGTGSIAVNKLRIAGTGARPAVGVPVSALT